MGPKGRSRRQSRRENRTEASGRALEGALAPGWGQPCTGKRRLRPLAAALPHFTQSPKLSYSTPALRGVAGLLSIQVQRPGAVEDLGAGTGARALLPGGCLAQQGPGWARGGEGQPGLVSRDFSSGAMDSEGRAGWGTLWGVAARLGFLKREPCKLDPGWWSRRGQVPANRNGGPQALGIKEDPKKPWKVHGGAQQETDGGLDKRQVLMPGDQDVVRWGAVV